MTHNDKIVLWGMSCVGKTYFAHRLVEHEYYCFDAMFDWHSIETLGLSISANLKAVRKKCTANKFVLDGWHLSDKQGEYLPEDSVVYVIYADYATIISQYRIDVRHPNEFKHMFKRWYYEVPYHKFPRVRYWENVGRFIERSETAYQAFLQRNLLII